MTQTKEELLEALPKAKDPEELAILVADLVWAHRAEAARLERERITEALRDFTVSKGINPAPFLDAIEPRA